MADDRSWMGECSERSREKRGGRSRSERNSNDTRETREERIKERRVISVTPEMIRLAVKELHATKLFVDSSLIANHLRRYYPIESNSEALRRELDEKLEDAVSVGLVAKCGPDAYCLPTLRQQAVAYKTDFTRFSEKYNERHSKNRGFNGLENSRSKLNKDGQTCRDSDSDDEDF